MNSSVPCIIASDIGFTTDDEFKNFLNLSLELMNERSHSTNIFHLLPVACRLQFKQL